MQQRPLFIDVSKENVRKIETFTTKTVSREGKDSNAATVVLKTPNFSLTNYNILLYYTQ